MNYYEEGTRYLPENADRASDYPEPPQIITSRYFDPAKAEKLTEVVKYKKRRNSDAWKKYEETESLRVKFYNDLKR